MKFKTLPAVVVNLNSNDSPVAFKENISAAILLAECSFDVLHLMHLKP